MIHKVTTAATIAALLGSATAAAAACRDANGRAVKCGLTTRTTSLRTTTINKTSHTATSGWILHLPSCGI
jgi:hypothetical protein